MNTSLKAQHRTIIPQTNQQVCSPSLRNIRQYYTHYDLTIIGPQQASQITLTTNNVIIRYVEDVSLPNEHQNQKGSRTLPTSCPSLHDTDSIFSSDVDVYAFSQKDHLMDLVEWNSEASPCSSSSGPTLYISIEKSEHDSNSSLTPPYLGKNEHDSDSSQAFHQAY